MWVFFLTILPQELQDHSLPVPSELKTWDIIWSIRASDPEKKPQHKKSLQEVSWGAVNELGRNIPVDLHVCLQAVPVFVCYFTIRTFYSNSIHVRFDVPWAFAFLKPTFPTLNTLPEKLTIRALRANHSRTDLIVQLWKDQFSIKCWGNPQKEIYSWAGIYFNDLKLIQVNILAFKFMISVHVTLQAILIFKNTFAKRTSLIETIHMGFYMSRTSTFLSPSFSTLNTLPDNLVVHPQNPIHAKFFLIINL